MMDCSNEIGHYQCKRCSFKTTVLTSIRQHWENNCDFNIPEEVVYKCSKCCFLTHSRYLMLRHGLYNICATTDDERKKLFICCRVNNTENNESLDIQLIPTEFPQNEQFGSKFKDIWQSGQNKDNLKPNIGFQCEYCSANFIHKPTLKSHMKYIHFKPEEIQWFECELCPSTFKRWDHLNKHKLVHSTDEDIQWFTCELCSANFKRKRALKSHIHVRHSKPEDISWFKCELCSSKLKTKSSLKSHMYVRHCKPEDITWFKCELCPSKFKTLSYLKKHKNQQHSGDKKIKYFECVYCPKKYRQKTSLINHISFHHMIPDPELLVAR